MKKYRIRFAPWNPWSKVVPVGNTSTQGGYAGDLYKSVAATMDFPYEVELQSDFKYGGPLPDGTWNGMLGATLANETDIAGPYLVDETRDSVIRFSSTFDYTDLSIISRLTHSERDPFLIVEIFDLRIWMLLFFSLMSVSAAASVIYSVTPARTKRKKTDVFLSYLSLFYGNLVGQGCPSESHWAFRHVWSWTSFRSLFCIWLMGPVLITIYSYQAGITSVFAAEKWGPMVSSLEELREKKDIIPRSVSSSFIGICLKGLKGTKYDDIYRRLEGHWLETTKVDQPVWLSELETENIIVISETLYMKAMLGKRFQLTGKCMLRAIPINDVCTSHMAIGFRKDFPLKVFKKFNQRVRWYSEARLGYRHLMEAIRAYELCIQHSEPPSKPLNLSHLFGVFLIYFIGVGLSIVTLILEIVTAMVFKKKKQKKRGKKYINT